MENQKQPLVTVIVMTYNQEAYIGKALESIAAQKVDFPMEVYVGDDGSTDRTGEVIRAFEQRYPYMHGVIREKNLGMIGNVVDLASRARGKYLAFLDGDDYWTDENKLSEQISFLEAHSDYIASTTLIHLVNADGSANTELEPYMNFVKHETYTLEDFNSYVLPGQTSTLVIRNIVQEHLGTISRFFQYPNVQGDIVCMEYMLSLGKIQCFQKKCSAYRYMTAAESGSWSSKRDNHKAENVLYFCKGLRSLEEIGRELGLEVHFEDRRFYEIKKILRNREERRQKEYQEVIRKIIKMSDHPVKMRFLTWLFCFKKVVFHKRRT